jgi:hypothetical protein
MTCHLLYQTSVNGADFVLIAVRRLNRAVRGGLIGIPLKGIIELNLAARRK